VKYIYLVFLLLVPISLALAETDNSTASNCSSKITKEEKTLSSAVNQNKAIALANIAGNFTSIVKAENFEFAGIQYDWTIDNQTCSVALKDVNVNYLLGAYCCGNNVVFQENPELTTITNITTSSLTCGTFCPMAPQWHYSFCVSTSEQHVLCHGSPLEQFKRGAQFNLIECSDSLPVLVKKLEDGSPACTSLPKALKLAERGWGIMIEYYLPRA